MGDLRKLFGTSSQLEKEGVWTDLGDGVRVLVARSGNEAYRAASRDALRPHRAAIRAGTLTDDAFAEITVKLMAETILLGWEGVEDEGQPVPYSKANAAAMLRKYKDFRETVSELSLDMARFREAEEGAAQGN